MAGEHTIVLGLGFGDEGKGAVVDALCSNDSEPPPVTVVRFNGGAQAAHTVVDGAREHTFGQFGSGTLRGVPTWLSRHVLVEPVALAAEARRLTAAGVPDPLRLLAVDADALLTTPIHIAANRTREDARGAGRHGSCGRGIGETVWYSLLERRRPTPGTPVEGLPAPADYAAAPTVGDCRNPLRLRRKLDALARSYAPLLTGGEHGFASVAELVALYREFAAAVPIVAGSGLAARADRGRLVFEGAQGVLLDEHRGFHPHTTWSTVTPGPARALLAEFGASARVLGVTRSYTTRHGAGPLPSEDPTLRARFPERHNDDTGAQGAWRAGHLDLVLLRYAARACGGLDGLAVTHLDRVGTGLRTIGSYVDGDETLTELPLGAVGDLRHQGWLTALLNRCVPTSRELPRDPDAVLRLLESELGAPVLVTGCAADRSGYTVRIPVPC